MTTTELCESAGLTPRELQNWINKGLLDAEKVGRTSIGGPAGNSPRTRPNVPA
jgi:hypothetical protein